MKLEKWGFESVTVDTRMGKGECPKCQSPILSLEIKVSWFLKIKILFGICLNCHKVVIPPSIETEQKKKGGRL